jgi:hypothetical protein
MVRGRVDLDAAEALLELLVGDLLDLASPKSEGCFLAVAMLSAPF